MVREVRLKDAAQIAEIYNFYIENSHVTFETEKINGAEMERRISEVLSGKHPFLVCEENGEIIGYAYGHQFRPRCAYLHSIEISVYIRQGNDGKGIGTKLYERLFAEIKSGNFRVVIAGIALPNEASIRLHEKFGMEKVAHFREVGYKFDRWIDTGYWELVSK